MRLYLMRLTCFTDCSKWTYKEKETGGVFYPEPSQTYKMEFYKIGYNNISYNNDNVVITISWYIENPGIVRTACFGIFRHIQEHSAIFNHGQAYWEILRHIKVYSGIIKVYEVIIRHSRNSAYRCIYQRIVAYTSVSYSEPWLI